LPARTAPGRDGSASVGRRPPWVVGREYAIPAVVGTGLATALIRDGQAVEVDRDAGTVRVLAAD
jgi:phosphohistidine swiveling domain-containing protein